MNIADIQTLTRFLTKTNTTSFTAANLLILTNKYYEEVVGKIITETAGGDTQFGDFNYSAFPTYAMDLTASVADYSLRRGTIEYDAEGTAFTVGLVLTGGTSGATGMIEVAQDDGSSGTLTLSNIDGTFQDNETITDSGSGTATSNGLLISTVLTLMGAEITDNTGNTIPLTRISLKKIRERGFSLDNYQEGDGQPFEYELREHRIVLYPSPDNGVTVTLADGLILYYLQTADKFTSTEVTTAAREPGFPSPWHDLLAYGPAYDFAVTNGLPNAGFFKVEYDRRLKELLAFINKRDQDIRPIMTPRRINTGVHRGGRRGLWW